MGAAFRESNIDWEFEDGWTVVQYDGWSYYRTHFQGCAESKAIDFLAVCPKGEILWLVEVKDFTSTQPDREKGPLWDIVTKKARDTLAGLVAASIYAGEEQRAFARQALGATKLRVAFHCERPTHPGKLFKNLPSAADLQQKLRQTLRAVDTKVLVLDCASPAGQVPWSTKWNPNAKNP